MSSVKMFPKYDTKIFTDIYDNANQFLRDWKACGLYSTNLVLDSNIRYLFYLLYAKYGNSPIANYDEEQFKYKMWSIIFQYGPTWEKRLDVQKTLRQLTDAQLITGEGFSSQLNTSLTGNDSNNIQGSETDTGTINNTTSTLTGSTGTKLVNHAYNPSTPPATDVDTPLTYINQQEYEKDTTSGNSSGTNNTSNNSTVTSSSSNTGNHSETGQNALQSSKTKGKLEAYMQLWELLKSDVTSEFVNKFRVCFKQFVMPEEPLLYVTYVDEDEEDDE